MTGDLHRLSLTRRRLLLGATAIAANALATACGGSSSATDTPKPPPSVAATSVPPTPAPTVAPTIPPTTPPTVVAAPTLTPAATTTVLTPTPFVAQRVPTATPFIVVPTVAETFATPTGTPITPLIIFTGGSHAYGDGVARTETFPAQTIALLAPTKYDAVNLGVSAVTVSTLNTQAARTIDPLYAASRSKNIVVLAAGPNDLGAASVEGTFARLVTFGQARRSVGFKFVMLTLSPRTTGGEAYEAMRQALNESMRKNLASFADALADVGADPTIGTVGVLTNREYFQSDGNHPTGKGYSIIAGYVKAAILTL